MGTRSGKAPQIYAALKKMGPLLVAGDKKHYKVARAVGHFLLMTEAMKQLSQEEGEEGRKFAALLHFYLDRCLTFGGGADGEGKGVDETIEESIQSLKRSAGKYPNSAFLLALTQTFNACAAVGQAVERAAGIESSERSQLRARAWSDQQNDAVEWAFYLVKMMKTRVKESILPKELETKAPATGALLTLDAYKEAEARGKDAWKAIINTAVVAGVTGASWCPGGVEDKDAKKEMELVGKMKKGDVMKALKKRGVPVDNKNKVADLRATLKAVM